MRPLVLLLAVMFAALAASPPTDPAGNRIRGEWRGRSLCTNLVLAPACKDETVRYVFTGPIGGTNKYHAAADRLVGKNYQPMGEMDLTYGAADSTWSGALNVPSCKECRWWFRIRGSGLIGGLTSAAQDTLRKVTAMRYSRPRGVHDPPK
jgi:hypothetical protein